MKFLLLLVIVKSRLISADGDFLWKNLICCMCAIDWC